MKKLSKSYKTHQESFWAGRFGDEYIGRNEGPALLASNLDFLSRALKRASGLRDCIEFGANVGMNLRALQLLRPSLDIHAIEINATAVQRLAEVVPAPNLHHRSILDFTPDRTWDLALIQGVLIHLDPSVLPQVYETLVRSTRRFLLVCEYYNPSPVAISYRGHENCLFKRDFAGEILDAHPQMQLIDYGFAYRRDPSFPQDDITWFLLEKLAPPCAASN